MTVARRPRGPDEQTLLGQFYTPPAVADLLVALTLSGVEPVEGRPPAILDPACGDGALLGSAYDWLAARGCSHIQVMSALWGFELSQSAADMATAALSARGDGGSPGVFARDFFACEPGLVLGSREVPRFDCILGNPPYLRSQNQDDLDPAYRERLFAAAARAGVRAHAKTDLFGFFIYHASRFLKIGGRLGFITPASWLTSEYAASLQVLLTGELRLSAIVSSSAESFFPEVEVHTVLLLAQRVDPAVDEPQAALRFVTLRRPLAELTAGAGHEQVRALAREIQGASAPREDGRLRVQAVPVAGERAALAAAPGVARNWSRHLRAPLSFERLFCGSAFAPLEQVGRVALGYKSLQNEFYYVDRATIDAYGIEARFLEPIVMLGDLDGLRYLQAPAAARWVFICREPEDALRGTGALQYIHAMARRPVARRKQSGPGRTIRAALAAQGGELWYGPRARPHPAHVWLRKAVDTVYAPLLFSEPRVVDQRCNYVEPAEGLAWELLAAVLTATTFAYALEVCGAASMGAGALEAATTRLRTYPVFDPRPWSADERAELVRLARVVWTQERPLDLGHAGRGPGPGLLALDRWVLARAGGQLTAEQLHEDLRDACDTRIRVARARRAG